MNKWCTRVLQAVSGAGIGLFIAKRGIDKLYYKKVCERLEIQNSELRTINEKLERRLTNLESMNNLLKNLITQEGEEA